MSEQAIDLNLLELGENRNPFDELASKIEMLNLLGKHSGNTEYLEQTLLFLERKFQDLQDQDEYKAKVLLQAVNANILMLNEDLSPSFEMISKNLELIKTFSIGLITHDVDNIDTLLLSNVIKNNFNSSITISDLHKTYDSVFNLFSQEKEFKNEWLIELNFKTSKESNHKPLEFIHVFIEALNKIPGVNLTLEDIKTGSIHAKIKAIFEDVTSKEEVKEALESARKYAIGKLEKDYSELEKADSETIKNNIESEILTESLQYIKSDENKEYKKLETESLKYDIENKKLENERLKLRLLKDRKDLIKELLADGFINQREMEMLIKGISFLKIENGILQVGENIDIIDNL